MDMNRHLLCFAGSVALALATAGATLAQDTQTTTTTQQDNQTTTTTTSTQENPSGTTTVTSQTTKTIENPDGSSTVIEYPANKEVMVNLTPAGSIPGASGTARILRGPNGTTINLNLSGLNGDVSSYNLYAVDPAGAVTALGPVTISNGAATQTFTTPLNKFMLVLSPEANLASYSPSTNVVLRSAVPEGYSVVPFAASRPKTSAEHVSATTSPAPSYNVPMLNVPSFKLNAWNPVHVRFSGPLAGSRMDLNIRPRKDQTTEIHANFHHLMRPGLPPGTRIVLWSVAPDNTFTRIGQVVDTGNRNKADIHTETALKDFGLFVTTETGSEEATPSGPVVGTITVQP